MAIKCGMFDSTSVVENADGFPRGNKAVDAAFFARYFSKFISNGIYALPSDGFAVSANGTGVITVNPGDCFINGYYGYCDESQSIGLTPGAQERTVTVVLRLDLNEGEITLDTIEGDSRELTRNSSVYELALADVRVKPNGIITGSDITDLRLDRDKCGIVVGAVTNIDTSSFARQLNSLAVDAENAVCELEENFDDMTQAFTGWFDDVQQTLNATDFSKLKGAPVDYSIKII